MSGYRQRESARQREAEQFVANVRRALEALHDQDEQDEIDVLLHS